MLSKVISGGQSGCDQGALRAARACGIPTGGFAPRGWRTEDGPAPWLAEFGLVEHESQEYPLRTVANVEAADGTLWFGRSDSPGGKLTHAACRRSVLPMFKVVAGQTTPNDVVVWIRENNVRRLNVAGNRESSAPGIGERVERFLMAVFRKLKESPKR